MAPLVLRDGLGPYSDPKHFRGQGVVLQQDLLHVGMHLSEEGSREGLEEEEEEGVVCSGGAVKGE